MNQLTFKADEKTELKEAATYIWYDVPPLEQWVKIRQELPPQAAIHINDMWKWVGISLHAFFGDYPDPLPYSGLEETLKQLVQENSTKYATLSLLIFQAERFLQQEALKLGLPIIWDKRSDILKIWAEEHCRYQILLCLLEDWESHSEKSREERLKKIEKYVLRELKEEEFLKLEEKWEREDAKLCRPSLDPIGERPFTYFCVQVFYKYCDQLPAFKPWVQSTPHVLGVGKFRWFDGAIRFYPGRKRNKRKNPEQEPLRDLFYPGRKGG